MNLRLLFSSLALASLAGAQTNWGPAVGSAAPGFSLPDQTGITRSLPSLLEENGAILVFFRSSDW